MRIGTLHRDIVNVWLNIRVTIQKRIMSFYLVWPDESRMTAEGFAKVAAIPAVFNSDWAYQEAPSKYMIERALRTYLPPNARKSVEVLTPISTQGFGESICNFLEWCELRERDWRLLDYKTHIVEGYQKEQSAGLFSASHRGLSPATVNLRVKEACNFLYWAHIRGLREEFDVPTIKVAVHHQNSMLSHGHRLKETEVRVGAVRQKPSSLHMPSRLAVTQWLESIRIEKGVTKHLMAELVINTAIRREEAVQWRVHTLPESKDDWKIVGNEVLVTIEYGAKGSKRYNERGDLVGSPRTICLPLAMAEKLHTYRETKRLKYFAAYIKKGVTSEERSTRKKLKFEQLFLSDFTGEPVSRQTFYDAWREATRTPYKGWSPHLGRHYWACNELIKELDRNLAVLKDFDKSQIPIDWIRGNVQDVILIRIQPQLGHIDFKTTERYIAWAVQQYRGSSVSDQFEQELEN